MNLYLAPMAGITDWPFRLLCFERGCDMATTEMISAQGLLTAPKKSLAYRFLIARAPFEGPLIAQIFGHDPYYMAGAARQLTETGRFVGIDINMGCPAQKVVGSGSGSALMRDERLAGAIVRAVRGATELPVSVKMRLGWDEKTENAAVIAHIAQEEGAALITVHGRTRMQQYSGQADLGAIMLVKQAVHIPVIANGDVTDGESAKKMLCATGCDGIAVGRGALGNPWIFHEIHAALDGKDFLRPSKREIILTAKRHARMQAAVKGDRIAAMEMRKFFSWYIRGMRGAALLRTRLNTASTLEEAFALLDEFEAQEAE
jgi:nifR3 family TIM-barrel protein